MLDDVHELVCSIATILVVALAPPPGLASSGEERSLSQYAARRIGEALVARTSPTTEARVHAAETLYLYADDVLPPTASDRSSDDSVEQGIPLTFASDTAEEIKQWLVEEDEMWVRYYLLQAIGELKTEPGQLFLLSYLKDPDPSLRAVATEYSGYLINQDVETRLVSVYSTQTFWWVRTAILESLGKGRTDESLNLLIRALDDPVRDVRAAACSALRERRDERSVPALVRATREAGLGGKDSPISALSSIGYPKTRQVLEEAVRSPYPLVRESAVMGLGEIANPASLPVLLPLLDDPHYLVRTEVKEVLWKFEGEAAWSHAISYLAVRPNERLFEAVLVLGDEGLQETCHTLQTEATEKARKPLTSVCARLQQRLAEHTPEEVITISSADIHTIVYHADNADAREIVPAQGNQTIGWIDAVGEENGGQPVSVDAGEQVTVWRAILYEDKTWLRVSAGPYGDRIWVREADLMRIRL